ncbi:MAG: SDR family oxidoreductase [Thermoplasmatota archaeon]
MTQVVLITGTSSGIGRECVYHFVNAGWHVIATARNLDDIKDLASDDVTTLALDVTKEDSMVAAVAEVERQFGPVDALVNNAGFGTMLPVEETPLQVMRDQFEVNVFGAQRLTQLVLPGMRQAGRGRIVNVSSTAGHVVVPMMGSYSASKFAMRAFTTALAMEVKPFGIQACLVEPGVIKTAFGQRSQAERHKHTDMEHSPYRHLHEKWDNMRMTQGGAHPRVIARQILHAASAKRPRFHYFAPFEAKAGNFLKRTLPDSVLNGLMGRHFWKGNK